jgi:hypothetical protein
VVADAAEAVGVALAALERYGLLLFSDPALPSLAGMIVGGPLRGSWWGHPRGNVIYHAMNALGDDPHVLCTKLVAGKVTYVHQRLWAAVYALGCAREAWQLNGLSAAAKWLLEQVDADEELQTDLVVPPAQLLTRKKLPDAARELERRLLVHATEVHTPSGAHAKVLETWPRWAAEVHLTPPRTLSPWQARDELEQAAERLAADIPNGMAALPWSTLGRTRGS